MDTINIVAETLRRSYPGVEVLSAKQLNAAGVETRNRFSRARIERAGIKCLGRVEDDMYYAMPGLDTDKVFPTRGHLLDYVVMTKGARAESLATKGAA